MVRLSGLLVAAVIAIWAPKGVKAQEATGLNLASVYELARQNDRQWRLARMKRRESEELYPQARAQLLPNVTYNASWTQVSQELSTSGTPAPAKQTYASPSQTLVLRQALVRPRLFHGLRLAEAQQSQALWTLRDEEQQLAVRVVTTYLESLLAQDRQALLDAQMSLVKERLASAQAGLRAGLGTRNDVDDATAELDRIKAQAIQIEQAIQLSRKRLELLTGVVPKQLAVLNIGRFDSAILTLPDLDQALRVSVEKSPRLLAAKQDILAAEALLKQADSGHLPTLDLVAQVARSTGENSFFASTSNANSSVGLQFSLPIYAGGAISSAVRQAFARLDQATETYEAIANAVRVQANTEYNAVRQGRALIFALQTALGSAEQALLSSRRGQQAGVRTLLDVLRAESQRYQVQVELAQARYDLMSAWFRLQALAGALTYESVLSFDALLD